MKNHSSFHRSVGLAAAFAVLGLLAACDRSDNSAAMPSPAAVPMSPATPATPPMTPPAVASAASQ